MFRRRKLFCEISPLTYKISCIKGCFFRGLRNLLDTKIAKRKLQTPLPFKIYSHNSLIRRQLGDVDLELQDNKAVNLSLSAPKVNGILIAPGEEFSFWALVGSCTAKKGYLEGLVVKKDGPGHDYGGGMCQFTNLIHWMVLHTPMVITEHHHHDRIDLFPDNGRMVPFGTGTSIFYNYKDYRFKNTTDATYQILVHTDDKYLCGEIRSDSPQPFSYHVRVEDEHFTRQNDGVYRNGRIMQKCIDKRTGNQVFDRCIKVNYAKILYDEAFVLDKITN